MTRPAGRRPVRLGEALRESVRELGWERRLAEEEVLTLWPEAVGPRVANHAGAARLSGGRLTVVASSSVWAQQLMLLRPELLRRVAERCGPGLVTEIFVVTGPVAPPEPPAPEAPSPAPPLGELPPAVDREIAAIADGETREAVRRSARVSLANPRPAGPPTRRGADP